MTPEKLPLSVHITIVRAFVEKQRSRAFFRMRGAAQNEAVAAANAALRSIAEIETATQKA